MNNKDWFGNELSGFTHVLSMGPDKPVFEFWGELIGESDENDSKTTLYRTQEGNYVIAKYVLHKLPNNDLTSYSEFSSIEILKPSGSKSRESEYVHMRNKIARYNSEESTKYVSEGVVKDGKQS